MFGAMGGHLKKVYSVTLSTGIVICLRKIDSKTLNHFFKRILSDLGTAPIWAVPGFFEDENKMNVRTISG